VLVLTCLPSQVIEPPLQAVVDDATTTGEDKSDEDKSDDIAPPKPKRCSPLACYLRTYEAFANLEYFVYLMSGALFLSA
jgi:hypothetical protein